MLVASNKKSQRKSWLSKLADENAPSSYLDYRVFLSNLFERAKADFAGDYSWQKLAEDLGFGWSTVLHQIVKGYRPLSEKNAQRLAKALALTGSEKNYLVALVAHQHARSAASRQEAFQDLLRLKEESLPNTLDRDQLAFLAKWYHPVLMEMCSAPGLPNDPAKISALLLPELKRDEIEAGIALLQRLGLIVFDQERQVLLKTKSRFSTGHNVVGLGVMGYHLAMLERAREALQTVPSDRRDVAAMTLCVSEESLPKLKALLYAFQSSLLDEAEKHPGRQVFQLNMQLFPFSKTAVED